MKINTPVNDTEIDFPEHYNILSTTNLKGAITYCNDEFIEVSGFTNDELVGHNHNLVRHPDMPPAAFADLWRNLKRGTPWMGIVKNRCKDGSYYWVDAYVTPIRENGESIEYQSVRTKPERSIVRRAEAVYRDLMQNRKPRALRLPRISIRNKLVAGFAAATLPPVGALFAGIAPGGITAGGAGPRPGPGRHLRPPRPGERAVLARPLGPAAAAVAAALSAALAATRRPRRARPRSSRDAGAAAGAASASRRPRA